MKKTFALLLVLLMVLQAAPAGAQGMAKALPNSDPISHGTINTVTYLRWGKSELFPTLAMVGPGEEFDVYEYDADWVMVLYDTWVSQGSGGFAQSFYCYVERSAITCDPALEGDESAKADTGPGKRKGKKPKARPTAGEQASAAPEGTAGQTAPASTEPEPTVEVVDDEEYDWIIRTPGLCSVTINIEQATFTCSFALMAQKAGGTAPSSDPAFNHGMHTPYAATGFFGMVAPMSTVVENAGLSGLLTGSGGIEVEGQAPGTKFYLDTGAEDPALVNFTLNLQANYTLNPKITGDNISSGDFNMSGSQAFPLPVQLKKVGGGYKFVLPGMRPGGGDLTFPAILEKTFADPDRWDKEAREADRRRKEADKLMKQMIEKLKKQVQEEWKKNQENGGQEESSKTDPATVKDDSGKDVELFPLTTPDPLATLGPAPTVEPLATLGPPDEPLFPLTPSDDETATGFPKAKH